MKKVGLICLMLVCAKMAAMPNGMYFGAFAGKNVAYRDGSDVDSNWGHGRGFALGLTAGYGWRCGLRLELEGTYRSPLKISGELEGIAMAASFEEPIELQMHLDAHCTIYTGMLK
jgi:hypothetical protein